MPKQKNDQLQSIGHSLAHLLAAAVIELYPGAKNTIGPAIEDGFYTDFDIPEPISGQDLPKIEEKMRQILKTWTSFDGREVTLAEGRKVLSWNPYKLEMLEELAKKNEKITIYTSGTFVDLCRGGHVDNARTISPHAFKLTRVSGAYWHADQTQQQLQRIYGVAFENPEDLKHYFAMQEEAKKRDHRKLGEDLKLFFISDSVGAGLPLLMPRGEAVKRELMEYMRSKEEDRGYQYVSTPVLTQSKLYERSGHANYYLENMYATKPDEEGNVFYLKPMNCPHHHMIYEKMVDSYRDLPLRLSEHAGLYRYELSGTLTGLIRMRGPITQNDSHTYVTRDQVEAEFVNVLQLFEEVYLETGVKDYWFRLSLPDFSKEKYAGDREQWEWAGEVIRRCLKGAKADFVEELDEAAFYGPKVDVQIKNVLGKEDSIATVQLDIVVPERMSLSYVDAEGNDQRPLIIHKSIMGAFERFMAFLLEQTAGKLPLWLSPEHVRVLTVNQEDSTTAFAQDIASKARELGLRLTVDSDNESVGKKIRNAELMKVPYMLVIGQKEVETSEVVPRIRKDMEVSDEHAPRTVDEFLKTVANEVKSRVSKTSL